MSDPKNIELENIKKKEEEKQNIINNTKDKRPNIVQLDEDKFYDDYENTIFKEFSNKLEYGFLDRTYFNSIFTNMTYDLQDIFNVDDATEVGLLLYDLSGENKNYINIFSAIGNKKNTASIKPEGANYNIWWKQSNGIITHAFSKVIYKLICCTGTLENNGKSKSLLLNVPSYDKNKKMTIVEKKFFISSNRCNNINGDNYNDDNQTENGAKSSCLDFMVKYCLFLKKYFPQETEQIKKFCGCILNDEKIHGKKPESVLRTLKIADSDNVSCAVKQCKDSKNAYRPSFMRKDNCKDIIDCSIDVGGISAKGIENSSVGVNINQQCGEGQDILNASMPSKNEKEKIIDNINQEISDTLTEIKKEEIEKEEIKKEEIETEEIKDITDLTEPEPKINFFQVIINWFISLFSRGQENFTNKKIISNIFFNLYLLLSLIIIEIFIFNDPLKLKKKLKFIK